ncbi:MAG TPA: hypothetical protein VNL37_07420, partial [Candidatus Polarisedimenticolia bacterium]|nr:hypothetical protein [Candidatus Polarisedimenticolia bacterium]
GLDVTCTARLRAPLRPQTVGYLFTSRSGFTVPSREGAVRHRYTVLDETARDDGAPLLKLLLPEGGDLAVSVRAEFDADLLGVRAQGGARVFQYQATVTGWRRLLGGGGPPEAAEGAGDGHEAGAKAPR